MIRPGENTLRSRAAAAISRKRLDQEMLRERAAFIRRGQAFIRIRDLLGVVPACPSLPVDLDGLEFTVEEQAGEWVLCLLQPCQSVLLGNHYRDCAEQVSTPIRCLADLGEALEAMPGYCAGCED